MENCENCKESVKRGRIVRFRYEIGEDGIVFTLPRLTLSSKVFLIASLNLVLLALVFLVFLRLQFRLDLGSFLLSPIQDRILAEGRELALQLSETDPEGWDERLADWAREHDAEVSLVDAHGARVAGSARPLPFEILQYLGSPSSERRRPRPASEEARRPATPLVFRATTRNPMRHWVGIRLSRVGARERSPGALIVSSASGKGELFGFDPRPWLAVGGAVIVISALCWLPLVRGVTRSLSRMTGATARIAEGQFDIQLAERRRDELGRLSASINQMSERLAGYVRGQKRFLGDIAHELCSPLARIEVALSLLERSAAPEQQSRLADLREDVQQMSALVAEVLSFSKAGLRPAGASLEPVDVNAAAARVLERERTEGAEILCRLEQGVRVLAEPDLFARALSNVVRNAIRYAGNAGPIEISARAWNGWVAICVADCGPGLAAKDLEAVFEPFYRPEGARERETGGAGLGLAIVKTCVESCQGTVVARNRAPRGLEVEIRLRAA